MTPTEKAKELVKRMHLFSSGDSGKDDLTQANAKQCALIAVEETMKIKNLGTLQSDYKLHSVYQYWQEVKTEIETL